MNTPVRRYFILFVAVFILVLTAGAQQWGAAYVIHQRNIYSIVIFNPQNITISGGNDYNGSLESVFHSHDFGLNWDESPADTFNFDVRSIAFSDSMHGFGSGFFGNFVRNSDGGYIWPRDTLPINRNFFKAIYATPSEAFLAGGEEIGNNMQTILKSTDGSNSWTVVRDVAGPVLRSICFTDSLNGCAIGDTGTILRTIDGGNTWLQVASPVQLNLNSITFLNTDTGYIVGGQQYLDSIRVILRTVNGGASWTVLKNQLGPWLTDISFLNKDTGYIVGDRASFLVTTDGGQTWLPQTVTNATGTEYFTSVRFYNQGFGIIGSMFGKVFVYSNPPVVDVKTSNVVYDDHNGQRSISLTGMTNTHGRTANMSFIISSDSLFSNMFETPFPNTLISNSFIPMGYDITDFQLGPGTYYFAAKMTNTGGSYYGDTLKFVIVDSPSILRALPYTNVGVTSLTLQGQVSNLPPGSNVFFEYINDTILHTVAATPGVINDTLTHNVSADITGLIPNTGQQYQYRVKATNGINIYYSDYLPFNITLQGFYVNTEQASNVTTNSATLQGNLNGVPLPGTIWFEYVTNGITTTVPAVPATVNDTLPHNASAQLTGLMSDSSYQFRIKVILDSNYGIYGNYCNFVTTNSFKNTYPILSPNPTRGNLDLVINSLKNQPVTVNVFDMAGRKMISGTNQLLSGYNSMQMDLGNLAAGTYTVEILTDDIRYSKKLLLVH